MPPWLPLARCYSLEESQGENYLPFLVATMSIASFPDGRFSSKLSMQFFPLLLARMVDISSFFLSFFCDQVPLVFLVQKATKEFLAHLVTLGHQ